MDGETPDPRSHEYASIGEVEYTVLGPLAAVAEGQPRNLGGPRQRMVLAVLLANANRVVSQEALIDSVWDEKPPTAARSTLHSYVSNLRREVAEDLTRDGAGYRIGVTAETLDALRFEDMVDRGRSILAEDSGEALEVLDEALGLWYGSPYGELRDRPALMVEASRLEELRRVAVESRIEAHLALGNHARVVGELETLVREHPYRERLHGMLMLALYRSGRQAEALRVFQRTSRMLGEELGIEPSVDLRELEQRILVQDPALEVIPPRGLSPERILSTRAVRGYELREIVGRGDYGLVHRAFQPSVGREVAVKVIRPEYVNRPAFVSRFESEARLVAELAHPHIVPLYDYWREPEGAYLVMPLLRGGSLSDTLQRGAWNLIPALRLLDQVGSAIGFAHRQGVLHRDIKPSNVLLDQEGNAYLSDFGIATRLTDDAGTPMTTSLAYVPPEELRGEPLSTRSDIFCLGVLAFHLLTGVPPTGHRGLPPGDEARPGLPHELKEVVQRATADSPEERYHRVEDFLRAVRQAVGTDVVSPSEAARSAPAVGPTRNPYKGLRSFMETDAVDFHGRNALTDELLRALGSNRLVTVVGPSGSGKSSAVRAGLAPALRAGGLSGSRGWLISEMFPGSYPFEELEAALVRVATDRPASLIGELTIDDRGLLRVAKQILPADDSTLILIIDQFEELFSMLDDEAARRLFLNSLATVASDERSRVRVVVTLRADFFDRPLEYPRFRDAMTPGLVTVSKPDDEGLAQAIAAPARGVGVEVEPGLVGEITADVRGQPGGLPLLQYALTEVFNRRDGNTLTIDAYRATGGVLGALGRRAEEIYEQLNPEAREAARQLFLRLVTVDEVADDTRRRVRQTDLKTLAVDQRALDRVLKDFGAFRFLTFDRDPVTRGPTVEVAHEALLKEWQRLRGWIDDQREDLAFHRRLNSSAREWEQAGRDPSFLLRGSRLEQALPRVRSGRIALTAEESEYLEESQALQEAEDRTSRSSRRRTITLLTAALVVITALAVIAWTQRDRAEAEAREANARRLAGESTIALTHDPELAILLGLESAYISYHGGGALLPETVAALHHAIQVSRLEFRVDGGSRAISISPDGSLIATDWNTGGVVVRDGVSGQELAALDTGEGLSAAVAFSPDGNQLAVGQFIFTGLDTAPTGHVSIWDLSSRTETARLRASSAHVVWSPDGSMIATAYPTIGNRVDRVTVWEVASGSEVLTIPNAGFGVDFLDSRTLVVGDRTGQEVRFYALDTGAESDILETPGLNPSRVIVDDVRGRLIVANTDVRDPQEVRVYDLESRELVWSNPVSFARVAVNPTTGEVATFGGDGKIRMHDPATGAVMYSLDGHSGQIEGAAFHNEGERLISVASDGETLFWDVSRTGPDALGTIDLASFGPPFPWVISGDGDRLAGSFLGGFFHLDLTSGQVLRVEGHVLDPFRYPAQVSPDWTYLAWVDGDGVGRVETLHGGGVVSTLPQCTTPLGFNHDGTALVLDGFEICHRAPPPGLTLRSRVVDPQSGAELLDLGARRLMGPWAAFSSGAGLEPGRYLAVVAGDQDLEIHDMTTSLLVGTLNIAPDRFDFMTPFSGRHIAGGTANGRGWVLDVGAVVDGTPPEMALVFDHAVHTGGVPAGALRDSFFATGAFGSLRLWDVRSGMLLVEPNLTLGTPPSSVFTPDGRYLLYADSAHFGSVIRRLPLLPDDLIALGESRVSRRLTDEECLRYLVACPEQQ